MKLKNSKIIFNNIDGVYRPGDILTGTVEINFNSTKIVRDGTTILTENKLEIVSDSKTVDLEYFGIFIEITGKASVYWTESDSTSNSDGTSSSTSTTYSNKEKYFKEKFYVVGMEKSNERTELPPGQHVYQFKYLLPSNIPPTFQGIDGKIIYSVRATLDRPWKIDKYVETPFIVESLTNIQDHPVATYKEPKILTLEKQFGVIFKSKPLTTTVKIPHSGFARGQVITLTLDVDNSSNTAINSISVKLKQMTTFHATAKDNKVGKTITKNPILFEIKSKTYNSFNHTLSVPEDIVLYDLTNCKIIDIDYELMIELHTAGLTTNLIGKMPLYPVAHYLLNATIPRLGPQSFEKRKI